MDVTIDFFERLDDRARRELDARFESLATLLGTSAVAVREGPLEGRGAPVGEASSPMP